MIFGVLQKIMEERSMESSLPRQPLLATNHEFWLFFVLFCFVFNSFLSSGG